MSRTVNKNCTINYLSGNWGKICPSCTKRSGPRSLQCPHCGHTFIIKAKHQPKTKPKPKPKQSNDIALVRKFGGIDAAEAYVAKLVQAIETAKEFVAGLM